MYNKGGCQDTYSNTEGCAGIFGMYWLCATYDNILYVVTCVDYGAGFQDGSLL